ncbi:MAG: amino acid adenylation domain-containing protein [Candidatus Zhuqueibacterota bacterium]
MSMENIEDIYPLSPMQQGMLFHSIYAPESGEYIEQMSCKIDGQLDVTAFERAWQEVLNRHTILRTAFVWEDLDEPLQVVQSGLELKVNQLGWRTMAEAEIAERLHQFLETDRKQGFDLSEAPLMRVTLIQRSDDVFQFVWTHHHLLLDGWSVPLLLGEVFAFYDGFHTGQPVNRATSRPYRDYIAWLQQQDLSRAEAYWRERLSGFVAPTSPALDVRSDGPESDEDYCLEQDRLSETVTDALQNLSRTHQITLNTFMQGAWALLLSHYSGEDDVVFGMTVSGRPPELLDSVSMLGIFINTLPIRALVTPESKLLPWLNELQKQQSELRQFEYSALTQIQGWSQVPRELPLFESIFVFENYPVEEAMKEDNSSVHITDVESFTRTNLPITVSVSPGKRVGIEILYDHTRFSTAAIKRLMGHMKHLLGEMAANPNRALSSLSVLTDAEKKQLLVDWNNTDTKLPDVQCVHQWIEQQVEKTPNAIAVTCSGEHLTYQELNERANQLAHYLIGLGVGPEVMVGVMMEHSLGMMVGLLGILKASGAYVPMDPYYPKDRIEYILTDSRIPVLLTQRKLLELLPETGVRILQLDEEWDSVSREARTSPAVSVNRENLVYMIYTSGSTGKPKGTLITHRGLINYLHWCLANYPIEAGSGSLVHSSLAFDATVTGLFAPLLTGRTVTLVSETKDVEILSSMLQSTDNYSLIKITPAHLELLGQQLEADAAKDKTRAFIIGGENLTSEHIEFWKKHAPETRLINEYGPTETVVGCMNYVADPRNGRRGSIPIGYPICNTKIYLLDSQLQPVPIGVPGELYIGGEGVARGYHNRPDLTAARFIPSPFSNKPGARLYRSGDLARYLGNGNIEFLGRIDHQVKIRGFRIELGEIEENLNQHPAVQNAVALVREDKPGDKRLVAYFVPNRSAEASPSTNELRDFLAARLPHYMIPNFFVMLENMPLTSNGKVNRKALPAPELDRSGGMEFIAPRTPTEELMAQIWAEVLGIEQVGIYDNFFELGGHSLIGMKLQSRVQDAFQMKLPLSSIFQAPTVAELAQRIDSEKTTAARTDAPPIVPVSRDQQLPLSFAQHRLWFLDQLEPNSAFYNIPTALRFKGKLNVPALEKSFAGIITRHESLRTTFQAFDGKPFQVIAAELPPPVEHIDFRHHPESEKEDLLHKLVYKEAQTPFDLSAGPLVRMKIAQLSEDEFAILVTMHHIISDGWSITVFIQEMAALYEAFSAGGESPLPSLTIQYPDFAHWQRQWLQGAVLDAQISFWKEQLAGCPPILELPTDRPRPAVQSFNGATLSQFLSGATLDALKKLSREQGCTLFITLLAAFKTLLHRYSGQTDICVGTPIASRNNVETEKLIGFFVNTLVMRSDLSDDPTFLEFMRHVRETALDAYAHQDVPFETVVEAVQPERNMSHSPLFQVMFVLQEARKASMELSDVTITALQTDSGNAKFDLTLEVLEGADQMELSFEYNTDLFNAETIERMAAHFAHLVESIVADPEQRLSALPILSEAEKHRMLIEWNQTAAAYPDQSCVHEVFQQLAGTNPDAVAATYEAASLTYGELNKKANQLARNLLASGLKPEQFVGICMERSLDMVVGILATLKAGGAFVPLDPAYPSERLAYMISDSRLTILLSQERLKPALPENSARTIFLDSQGAEVFQGDDSNVNLPIVPENLAYMIYTSGSTGKPKGTMLQHRGMCNLAQAQQRAFDVTIGSRILQFSSLSFDASVWETVMALLNGSTLCLTQREHLASGQALWQVLREEKINTVTLPPSVAVIIPDEPLPDLKVIITAGEKCTAELVSKWSNNGRKFFNAYGPTETTVCASMLHVARHYRQGPPIGRPIHNFQLYILDPKLNPTPVGVAGELHIGGVGLARGYFNRPDLTAEKFIADPFNRTPGARMYKSGDLARFLPDGNIEFLGRIDHQVKVRGFRIELGEIEAVLAAHPDITDVVVLVREDMPGDKRLVAYLVVGQGKDLTVGDLRGYLRERLPDYMIPSAFMILNEFPLTPNGKVDRKALPAPDQSRPELGSEYVAPGTEHEIKLAAIVAELLKVEKVGIHDNFFDLGGHSLLATQFISRTRDAFQVELPLRSLFEKPTVAGLVEEIEKVKLAGPVQAGPSIKRVARDAHRVKLSELN